MTGAAIPDSEGSIGQSGRPAPTVVIIDPAGRSFADEVVALLERGGCKVITSRASTEEELVQLARGADGLIYGGKLSRQAIEQLDRCKVVARSSIGMDGVDGIDLATAKGIVLCNMPGVIEEEVADQTMALLLGAARGLLPFDSYVRNGGWEKREAPPAPLLPRLPGSALGLVGFGRIARAVARRAAGFGLRLLAYDPFLPGDIFAAHGVQQVTLGEILEDCTFVSLHVPLTAETHHLIGHDQFRLMRPDAFLINTCRGPVVDQEALIVALEEGWISGAGLDVMEDEPLSGDHALCRLPNVVLSPHVASRSIITDRDRFIRPAQEVMAVLAGLRPRAVWNSEVLDRLELR